MNIALRNEIKQGKASILCTLEDGKQEEYEVNVQKIFLNKEIKVPYSSSIYILFTKMQIYIRNCFLFYL